MASIALMPVWSGSLTGWRPMMPGAWTSMRRDDGFTRGPLPSRGTPRAFTTRPRRASPTGTERMRPVERTTCSSSIPSTEPSTTAPMVSSSKFIARPSVPSSNSKSSFTFADGSPDTRAMPSPTSTTRPTCSAPTAGLNSVTCLRSASVISAALMVSSVITTSFYLVISIQCGFKKVSRRHGVVQVAQTSERRRVETKIAHLDEHASE